MVQKKETVSLNWEKVEPYAKYCLKKYLRE